jgi:hypothetical protein
MSMHNKHIDTKADDIKPKTVTTKESSELNGDAKSKATYNTDAGTATCVKAMSINIQTNE